jgi:hypothetical protein
MDEYTLRKDLGVESAEKSAGRKWHRSKHRFVKFNATPEMQHKSSRRARAAFGARFYGAALEDERLLRSDMAGITRELDELDAFEEWAEDEEEATAAAAAAAKTPRTYACKACGKVRNAPEFPRRQLQRKAAAEKTCSACLREAAEEGIGREEAERAARAKRSPVALVHQQARQTGHWMESVHINGEGLQKWPHHTFEHHRQCFFRAGMPAILRSMHTCGYIAKNVALFRVAPDVQAQFTTSANELQNRGRLVHKLAFHGTSSGNLASIRDHGLVVPEPNSAMPPPSTWKAPVDPSSSPGSIRVRVANGSALGVGIYTSEQFSTSISYCRGHTQMLVCGVLSGHPSVTAHAGGTIVCFENSLVCPMFVVDYCSKLSDVEVQAAPLTKAGRRAMRSTDRAMSVAMRAFESLTSAI